MLPPRLREWKKGQPQIGAFLRTETGSTLQMVHDQASFDEVAFTMALMRGVTNLPEEVVRPVRDYFAALLKK